MRVRRRIDNASDQTTYLGASYVLLSSKLFVMFVSYVESKILEILLHFCGYFIIIEDFIDFNIMMIVSNLKVSVY